jgi:hypothetical protein
MEVKYPYEAWVNFQRTTQSYNPEDRTVYDYRYENLKSYKIRTVSSRKLMQRYGFGFTRQFASQERILRQSVTSLKRTSRRFVMIRRYSLLITQVADNDEYVFKNKQLDSRHIHFACVSTSKTLHVVELRVISPPNLSNV